MLEKGKLSINSLAFFLVFLHELKTAKNDSSGSNTTQWKSSISFRPPWFNSPVTLTMIFVLLVFLYILTKGCFVGSNMLNRQQGICNFALVKISLINLAVRLKWTNHSFVSANLNFSNNQSNRTSQIWPLIIYADIAQGQTCPKLSDRVLLWCHKTVVIKSFNRNNFEQVWTRFEN